MKKRYKFLFGFILVVVALCLVLQVDDDLSPEALQIVEKVDWQSPSESYLYYLGLDAELGADPTDVGKDILAEIRELEADYPVMTNLAGALNLRERETMQLGSYAGFCDARHDGGCFSRMFEESDIPLTSPKMVEARMRYNHFLSLGDYRTLSKPHFLAPFGSFSMLVRANRLLSLESVALAKSGRPELASENLYQVLALQRSWMSQTDTLISRMVSYVLINETIQILSLIQRQFNVAGQEIEPLSPEELSLEAALYYEFLFVRSSVRMQHLDIGSRAWPRWALQMVFKPNMTMNDMLPVYLQAIEISKLERPKFDAQASSVVSHSWFRNFMGSMVNKVGTPDFHPYIARGFDLNVKIALFNGLIDTEVSSEVLGGIENPYYERKFDAELSEDEKTVCMDGPFEDRRGYRCLIVALHR